MSLAEILDEIPRLTPVERQRVAEELFEVEGDWIDGDDELSPEEKNLLDSRVADLDPNADRRQSPANEQIVQPSGVRGSRLA